MEPLAGWDGPDCNVDGVFCYSKSISWIKLYINFDGGEFYGGSCGACKDYELKKEGGRWLRFETRPAWTARGEPVLRLRDYSTWDVIYERVSEGMPVEEEFESIEDLAAFLERSFA